MAEPRKHDNRVVGYLKPKQNALFKGFKIANDLGESEAVNMIIKDYFARVSSDERADYINKNVAHNANKQK